MEPEIRPASTDADIAACFPVMVQLRPRLAAGEFVARVRAQMEQGYRLAALREAGAVRAVAGYRTGLNLAWLEAEARRLGCDQLHLDSGRQRVDAHRFYAREGLDGGSLHFMKRLREER